MGTSKHGVECETEGTAWAGRQAVR